MTKLTRVWLLLWTYGALCLLAGAFPKRIPIGALFDHNSLQSHTAFRYEIERHNNGTQWRFKLDKYEKVYPVDNSHELKKSMCSIMSKGIFAFFGVTNLTTLSTLASYTNTFHMPYVTPDLPVNITTHNQSYILRMQPTYGRAMRDVVREFKWDRVFYIYDVEDALIRIQHLNDIVFDDPGVKLEIDAMKVGNINNCYSLLRNMDQRLPKGNRYIVLDLSTDHALQTVLKQIQNVGMNRANYHYLLGGLSMDELDLSDFQHGGVNITGFRLVNPDSERVQSVQREWSRLNPNFWKGAGTEKIKLEAALTMDSVSVLVNGLNSMLDHDQDVFRNVFRRGQVYNNGTRGIACTADMPWTHGASITSAFKNVNFEGVTGTVAFDEHGYRKDYNLDVIELSLNSEPSKAGEWRESTGLQIRRQLVKKSNETKQGNRTRIVTSIKSPPYLMLKHNNENGEPLTGNDRFEGYVADLAKELARVVGFDYTIRLVGDGKYGAIDENSGHWNGMVGELTREEADLAIAPLTISSIRERVIDFSKPFMSLGISIMIKKPEKQKPGVFSFMDPLSSEIWICIILAYLGVSIVLFIVSRFSPYEWQIEDSVNGPTFTNDFTILNSLWFSLGAFMQQGCDVSPRSMSGRIVGSVWWFFTLIIISSYTANLAAFLTVERMLTPIESVDDLAKQTEIQYGTLDAGSTKDFFKTSSIAVYQKMWKYMAETKPSVFVDSTTLGVERVRNSKGKYAFLMESTMNDYHNQRKPCNTMKVGDNLDSKGYGVATPLHSDLREEISLAVLRLHEDGELQKLRKKWWYDKGECGGDESKGSTQSALTLSNVAGIFYILIGGLGLSMVMSLLEFMYKSKVEARRQKTAYNNAGGGGGSYRSPSVGVGGHMAAQALPERENGGVGSPDIDVHKSMSTVPITRSSAVSLV